MNNYQIWGIVFKAASIAFIGLGTSLFAKKMLMDSNWGNDGDSNQLLGD